MLVTGVQAVGSKGVTAVQGTVVDARETNRVGTAGDHDADRGAGSPTTKSGDPQPVVFPRSGIPMDHRPVAMRHERAATRYRSDGGHHDDDHAA